jgi:nicotinamide phosphoribosyltransferase
METVGNDGFVPFQCHDFSLRGMSSVFSGMKSGAAHLLSFLGSDNVPSIPYLQKMYNAKWEDGPIALSVKATEHMLQTSYKSDREYIEELMDRNPSGILSLVIDGRDFWKVVTKIIPSLKSRILAREGDMSKIVLRPDSGCPELIMCGDPNADTEWERKGLVEVLWDEFGGTVNELGYKELNPKIGTIYGDSITLERFEKICELLKAKKFASTNWVAGIGSYTFQMNSRDTFNMAVKATYCKISDVGHKIFKDPVTDKDKIKKSQKGCVAVFVDENKVMSYVDNLELEESENYPNNLLQPIFKDGKLLKESTLAEIRERIRQ